MIPFELRLFAFEIGFYGIVRTCLFGFEVGLYGIVQTCLFGFEVVLSPNLDYLNVFK